jgi:CTD kinase subunit gamma
MLFPANSNEPTIMDAFQCRLHFTKLISNLTASAVAAKQCAQFALKNRDVDEDLFSVILEQLQSVGELST